MTLNEVRSKGLWVIRGNSAVKQIISRCVECKRLRGAACQQKMGDLPSDRLHEAAPFTYVGLDLFGPFIVKNGRKELKRYEIIFTCLSCRADHLEVVSSMSTDSFILALRRFIARRGNVGVIRCDNGTNFVGGESELRKAFWEMDHTKLNFFLSNLGTDWLVFRKNPPSASHMGGVWERQIRSARNIFNSLLKTHGATLNDESINTLFAEVEAILNSRPLTVETLNDPTSHQPLSPSNFLTMKTKVIMPSPGKFENADLYSRKLWLRVQHIANEFWSRWRTEFLSTLQNRQKWGESKRNVKVGDIVLLVTNESHRSQWPMDKVIETFRDENGLVRSAKIMFGVNDGKQQVLVRPIAKLVILLDNDDRYPDEGSLCQDK